MAREKAWAVAIARDLASQLPEAVRTLPNLGLTARQVQELRIAFENTLVEAMGEDADETPNSVAARTSNQG
jgi:hypothetical protein